MNTHRRNLFLILGSIAGLILVLTGRVAAQDFRLLHTFTDYDFDFDDVNNTDGIEPVSLIASGHTLYGITYKGGPYGAGTVFRMNSDGTGFTNLYSFSQDTDINDGNFPVGDLIVSGNTLYGATQSGGTNYNGTVFKINTDGSGLAILHKFSDISSDAIGTNSDGEQPEAGLILSGGVLYGTASFGGANGSGTVFALNTNGTGFRTLHSFTTPAFINYGSNSDGAFPEAGLVLSGDTLYGTASEGGTSGFGTIFAINTNGTGFIVLHSFAAELGAELTNNEGGEPSAGLVLSGDTLYGTAGYGGTNGDGTVFALNTNGAAFVTLHSFSGSGAEGLQPVAGLILSGGILYGTTYDGGTNDSGTVFALSTNGEGFTTLHGFDDDSDGDDVVAGVVLIDGVLYGAARNGGTYGNGTLFSMSLGPKLLMLSSGPDMVLSWPTNTIGFTLESSSSLGASAVWKSVSQAPVVVNANNTVTNPISGPQKFYRLSH